MLRFTAILISVYLLTTAIFLVVEPGIGGLLIILGVWWALSTCGRRKARQAEHVRIYGY